MVTVDVPDRTGNYGPLVSSGDAGIIQIGFDQVVKTQTIPINIADLGLIARDAGGNPLSVVLDHVKPGNFLECEWDLNLIAQHGEIPGTATLSAICVVSFDGTTAFPGTFNFVNNDSGVVSVPATVAGGGGSQFACVEIPPGATKATVFVAYSSDTDFTVGGTDIVGDEGTSGSLRVTEIGRRTVTQPGPSTLVPIGPFGPGPV